jgi:ribonucleases P/MRP protein subunit RPP40
MKRMGISGILLKWFSSYLIGRNQRVVLYGTASDCKYTNAGVPQGSILAPLLFLIYINDIDENIISKMLLFADDSILSYTYKNASEAEEILNKDLNQL